MDDWVSENEWMWEGQTSAVSSKDLSAGEKWNVMTPVPYRATTYISSPTDSPTLVNAWCPTEWREVRARVSALLRCASSTRDSTPGARGT
eukprot:3146815-Rhodomonas_salina.2